MLHRLRGEASLYSAAPSLAALQTAVVLDSLHGRSGGQGQRADGPQDGRLWARVAAANGKLRPQGLGVYGSEGAAFEHRTSALQVGVDVHRARRADGGHSAAGVYVAQAHSHGDVTHADGLRAGTNRLTSTSLGGYWTQHFANGAYLDVGGQYARHGLQSQSVRMPQLKTSGHSVALSVEGGRAYAISPQWVVEPQLQLRAQRGRFDNAHDLAGRVDFGRIDSLRGRAGVRLAHVGDSATWWVRADVLREFRGRSTTTLSNLQGLYGVGIPASLRGSAVGLSGGLDAQITPRTAVYAAGSYERRLGGRGHGFGAEVGLKVRW